MWLLYKQDICLGLYIHESRGLDLQGDQVAEDTAKNLEFSNPVWKRP